MNKLQSTMAALAASAVLSGQAKAQPETQKELLQDLQTTEQTVAKATTEQALGDLAATFNASGMFNTENLDDSPDGKDSVEGGKTNAEIAQAFEKDVGVELGPKFYDLIAQARAKLDERAYGRTLNFFQSLFKEKDPKTGGDLFPPEERQYIVGIAMELLANEYENPTKTNLKIVIKERKAACLPYFNMGKESYNVMLGCIKSSAEIDRMDARMKDIQKELQEIAQNKQKFDQEVSDKLLLFYKDCLSIDNSDVKRRFFGSIEKIIEGYNRRQEQPPQLIADLWGKVQSRNK